LLPVSIPEHLKTKEKHDDNGSIVGVDWRNERSDAEADQSRDDCHHNERDDGPQEDCQLVISHCQDG